MPKIADRQAGFSTPRKILLGLLPVVALLLAAEGALRVKYFLLHHHDWRYLFAPLTPVTGFEIYNYVKPKPSQTVFRWQAPCVDTKVFSPERQQELPRTWTADCLRGPDRVLRQKPSNEFRIFFLGGSTAEDGQSDEEMWATVFKRAFPPTYQGRSVTVVNGGKAGFDSNRISIYWDQTIHAFSPDLVVYYESWNEQPTDIQFANADSSIATIDRRLRTLLYYKSMLYTYIVEKRAFMASSRDRFWKVDLNVVRRSFTGLVAKVRSGGAKFVFATQIVRFPRMWKGVDTFDYRAIDALLDRLKADPQYVYAPEEISALNQRRTLFFTIELCRELRVPVISVLDAVEALGDQRADLFVDLGHLSVKGDRVVGALLAQQLASLQIPDTN